MSKKELLKPTSIIILLLFGSIVGVTVGVGIQKLQLEQSEQPVKPQLVDRGDLIFTDGSQPGGVINNQETTTTRDTNNSNDESENKLAEAIDGTVTIHMQLDGEVVGQGSGFLYNDSYIMTNNHVVFGSDQITSDNISDVTIYVEYTDGSWSKAKFVGGDKYSDIAIIKPSTIPESTTTLKLADSLPQQGQQVYAIGSPYGYDNSLTSGIISATGRSTFIEGSGFTIPDTIQTDAEIDQGNSGGPLVLQNDETTVVGVNRAKSGDSIGFAISSRLADRVGTELINSGSYSHNYVGFVGLGLNPTVPGSEDVGISDGIVVTDLTEDGPNVDKFKPASQDKIEDVIIGVSGQEVDNMEELSRLLTLNYKPGDTVQFTVYNDGETRTETITLEERPDSI